MSNRKFTIRWFGSRRTARCQQCLYFRRDQHDVSHSFQYSCGSWRIADLVFGYTNCPDLCPTTLADIRAALARIGDDASKVSVAFVTIDPERDTAQLLTNYLSSFVDRFHVLRTTNFGELQVAKDAFLAASAIQKTADGKVEVSHTATAYIIDESGLVVDELPFGVGSDGFENDLKILLREIEQS